MDFLKKHGIILILILVTILVLGIYLYQFHFGLSSEHISWSEFGDYFNGVLAPILTAINIYVFVRLTRVIDANDEKRQKQSLEHEKALIKMQFRKAEVDKLENLLSNVLIPNKETDMYSLITPVLNANIGLVNFRNLKMDLFDIQHDSLIDKNIIALQLNLDQLTHCLYSIKENSFNTESTEHSHSELDMKEFEKLMSKMTSLSDTLLASLQDITLKL